MRTFILPLFVAALCAPSVASADSDTHSRDRTKDTPTTYVTLELQALHFDGEIVPDVNGTVVRLLHGPFGAYSFFYVDERYAEALVGPLFAPTDWLVIGAGAGIEQGANGSWRVGGMLWMGNDAHAWTTFVETGASGPWARSEYAWKPDAFLKGGARVIGIGFLADTLAGFGPRLEINFPGTPFQGWQAALLDPDGKPSFAAGLRLNL